jgi:ABC-type glycerol-3-phosphate transport system substrate-binding protein
MKNNKLFQYVVIGIFVFFTIVGAIMFSTYRSTTTSSTSVRISMWGTLPADTFNAFSSRYFSNTELKYTIAYTERDPSTFEKDLVEAIASGVGPDAIILPEDLIVHFSNKIYNIPFAVLPELTYKQTFIQEGELYLNSFGTLALPFTVDPLVMYWNRDIFNNVSVTKPPANWADISSLAAKMTKKDAAQNILQSTVAMGEFRNVNNAKAILSTLFMQTGNPIVSLNLTDGAFSSALKAGSDSRNSTALSLQYFTNFSNPSRPEYSWNRSLTNSIDAFANGDLALYFGFASEYLKIKNKNPNLNFDVTFLPQIKGAKTYSTFGNMLGFAILKNSANPAGAYSIISALTSAQAVPFWTDIFNIPSARRDVLSVVNSNSVKTIFNQSAIMSRGWLDPGNALTGAIFLEMVESYTTGRATLEDAIGNASDRLDSLLK